MSFIDIHGHYAWNIDDGMPSYEDARKALIQLLASGRSVSEMAACYA